MRRPRRLPRPGGGRSRARSGVGAWGRMGGGRAEGDDQLWLDKTQLFLEPPAVMLDLAGGGGLVDAALAALAEFEVFDGVGDVGLVAVDAGFLQRPVEKLAGGADEGAALQVFLVTRLFTDEGDGGV